MINLVEQLRCAIEASAAGRCLLWVDPAQRDPYCPNHIVDERRVRVPISHFRFAMGRTPYLVPLDLAVPADVELFEDSVERALHAWTADSLHALCGQPISGWVTTQATPEELARYWGFRCHLHGHRKKCKLLRFQDPGVREWLWPSLSEVQRRALLGPAASLFAVGRRQHLLHHVCAAGADAPIPFTLDDQQWQQAGDFATAHAAWLACTTSEREQFSERSVMAALAHAKNFGVTQVSERELYARHASQLGSGFHGHARMQPVWERTRAGSYYGSAVEEVFECASDELHLHWTLSEEKLAWPT